MTQESNPGKITLTPLTVDDLGARRGVRSVTLDKQGRLCLSRTLRRDLGIVDRSEHIYVSVDLAQRVIGIVKSDVVTNVVNAGQLKVSKRGYATGRALLRKFGLSEADGPYRFDYVGKLDSGGADWHAFRLNSAGE
jgi:hypothetical protein